MKTKKLHILYLFVFVWSFSFGQQYKNYSISDGLPSNHVYRITQDYNGFIWFITDKGMVKFDGEIFKTFTTQNGLPTNDIWDIKITKNNRVWYVSKSEKLGYIENDIVYSFPSSKKGEVFSSNNTGQTKDSVSFHSNYSYYVLEDSVFRKYPLKKRNFERVLAHPEIKNIEWGTKFRTLHFLDKNDSPVWSPTELQLTNSNTKTNGQLNDSIYYVSDNNKVVLLNFNQKKHFTINFKDALKYPTIKHQRLHNVNNETQITGSHFVGKLTCNHSISQIHYIPENIDSHFSFIDKTGNIWAASFNKGVYFFPASEKYTKTYFRNQKAQEIKKIDSTIWVTIFRKGLYKLNTTKNDFKLALKNKEYAYGIYSINNSNEIIYSTENKVFRYRKNRFTEMNFVLAPFEKNNVGRNFKEHNKTLYSNVHAGVNELDPITLETKNFFLEYAISDFTSLKGQLIIGTSSGLKFLKKDSVQLIRGNTIFKHPILKIEPLNKDRIIVGTDGFGAYVFDGKKAVFINETKNFSIQDIFIENENSFWIATQKGVHQYTTKNNAFYNTASFFESDGLLANKVNSITIKGNLLYAATDIGITALDITRNNKSQLQSIYIDRIKFNGKIQHNSRVEIDYSSSGNLQINYGVIDYSNQDNLKKEYRLLPNQTSWIETSSNQINLNTLAPNKYTLELKTTNHHGSVVVKNITITIKPRFWQTLWFKILTSIILGSLLALTVWFISKRIQLKKEQKLMLEKELSEIQLRALRSQMNPHFVFNSLAAIQYFINDNDFESSELYLVKFSKLIRQFFELSKENEILLSEEIKLLQTYLEIEKLRFHEKLNFKINIHSSLKENKMSIPTMLLQPIVENAINHGIFNKEENGLVTINFEYIDSKSFQVEIIDDGVGYSNSNIRIGKKVKSSNILKDRIHYLNQSRNWQVTYAVSEMYPQQKDKGNKATFVIKHLTA